jgi:IPT/TIG domain
VSPPDPDIAVGPTQLVETTNSTVFVFSRVGGFEFSINLNTFLNGSSSGSYEVSDPRVLYDPISGRFFLSELDIYEPDNVCGGSPSFDVVLVAPSSTLTANDTWYGFGWLPFQNNSDGLFADQPGLGISSSLVAATQSAYDNCNGSFIESELLVIQKSDLVNRTFAGTASVMNVQDLQFGLQPVQELGANTYQYVVWNNSDSQEGGCVPSCSVGVLTVHGTPRAGNVVVSSPIYEPMTPTAVQCNATSCFTPPADQPGTIFQLQTDDDRFLNAVWEGNKIWTAGNTTCTPSGDTTARSCLDFVSVGADTSGNVSAGIQINDVGINGAALFYPAVSLDSTGNVITVFDQSSSSANESIVVAAIDSGSSGVTGFTTLHMSSATFASACDVSSVCRWGDYSGAAVDPNDAADVWVVSEDTDGNTTTSCQSSAQFCWNTYIGRYTFAGPSITGLTPNSGPVAGGQSVTVKGFDFAPGTTVTFSGAPIGITSLAPESFTFVTPLSAPAGGVVQTQATDSLGASTMNAASSYTYVGLANYTPVSPIRILDTRSGSGSPLGPGTIRTLTVPTAVVPSGATAVVLNMTEVNGTAASLLTLYPYGTAKPTASNLNFPAHTVIANLVTVSLGLGGRVNIFNAMGSVNVLADVEGYFEPPTASTVQGLFHPIAPIRVCDTRPTAPANGCRTHGILVGGTPMVVNVTSGGAMPSDGSAEAAVLNLTGVAGSASTYLSVFPTSLNGTCQYNAHNPPKISTLNLLALAVQANRVMVKLGPASTGAQPTSVCVYAAVGKINVLLDANGWYGSATAPVSPAGYQYQAVGPSRICDTRFGSASCPKAVIGAAVSRLIGVAGHGGVPATSGGTVVVAVIANLTAVGPTAATYLTLYPANLTRVPGASDLNVRAGVTLPNLAVVQLDTTGGIHDGEIYLYNSAGSVNAIIDIEGWFQ